MINIFERIVCGVDPPNGVGLDALRQAKRLRTPGGRLVAVTVNDWTVSVHAGWASAAMSPYVAETKVVAAAT